jgi:hypothetical protein
VGALDQAFDAGAVEHLITVWDEAGPRRIEAVMQGAGELLTREA